MHALLVVDVQNDFCPGGALEVPQGDQIVPFINAIRERYELVVFTQDWHPADHVSFASNHPGYQPFDVIKLGEIDQTLWPDHCVQHTPGAAFHPNLDLRSDDPVVRKGDLREVDSYSGFRDNDKRHETGLRQLLQERGVDELTIVGLAADVCVLFTVQDALEFGFGVTAPREGTRAIGNAEEAFARMAQAGATVT